MKLYSDIIPVILVSLSVSNYKSQLNLHSIVLYFTFVFEKVNFQFLFFWLLNQINKKWKYEI